MLVKVAGHVIQTDEILDMYELGNMSGDLVTMVYFIKPDTYNAMLQMPLDEVIKVLNEAKRERDNSFTPNPLVWDKGLDSLDSLT